MERINHFFCENKIPALFLKGPILAKVLYGDLSLRTSSDLDLLVSLDQLEIVEVLLQKMGYIKDEYIETILNDWKWRHHHFTFYHHNTNIKVEVHWRLNPGPGKEPNFKDLWNRKQELLISSKPLFYLSNEDLFFFLVTHGARHGWSRLRWLIDIHQLMVRTLNFKIIRKLFKKYNYLNVAGQALILSNELLGTSVDEALKILKIKSNVPLNLANEAMFYLKQMINLHNEPLDERVSRYHKHHLIKLMSPKQKTLFFLSFLFPYPEDAKTLPLPKKLHSVYFVIRPFLWIWRQCKKISTQGVRG
jgi:hypothetical protein